MFKNDTYVREKAREEREGGRTGEEERKREKRQREREREIK